jgi:hypothetical protein
MAGHGRRRRMRSPHRHSCRRLARRGKAARPSVGDHQTCESKGDRSLCPVRLGQRPRPDGAGTSSLEPATLTPWTICRNSSRSTVSTSKTWTSNHRDGAPSKRPPPGAPQNTTPSPANFTSPNVENAHLRAFCRCRQIRYSGTQYARLGMLALIRLGHNTRFQRFAEKLRDVLWPALQPPIATGPGLTVCPLEKSARSARSASSRI